jgi:pimeloyl-ACP methyl ester carboxylesterase
MSAGTCLDAPPKPMSDHKLTPAQQATDALDWSFDGSWPFEPHWHWVDGVRLHYIDEGSPTADPVVMVHGSPTWSYIYRKLIHKLCASGRRSIGVDHLGFGRSDKPHRQREYSLERHVRLFGSVLDRLSLRNTTLVVHGWGAPIGLSWAVRWPDRIKALVVLNGFLDPASPGSGASTALDRVPGIGNVLLKGAHRSLHRSVREDVTGRSLAEAELRAYAAPHPSWDSRTGILAFARATSRRSADAVRARTDELERALAQLGDKPALIAWGMNDGVMSKSQLDGWRTRLPQAEVLALDGVGHLVPEAATDELAAAILELGNR